MATLRELVDAKTVSTLKVVAVENLKRIKWEAQPINKHGFRVLTTHR